MRSLDGHVSALSDRALPSHLLLKEKANVAAPTKDFPLGGQRHLRYIKTERSALYTELLTSGRPNTYLADINEQITEQMLLLTKQMAEREGVTEQLKAQDQMLWVQRMNSIRDRAMESVNHDLIYA